MKHVKQALAEFLTLVVLMTAMVTPAMAEELSEVATETVVESIAEEPVVEETAEEEPEVQDMTETEAAAPEEMTEGEAEAESAEGSTEEPVEEAEVETTDEPEAESTDEPTVEQLPAECLAEELGLTLEELAWKLSVDVDGLLLLDEEALRALYEQTLDTAFDVGTNTFTADESDIPTAETATKYDEYYIVNGFKIKRDVIGREQHDNDGDGVYEIVRLPYDKMGTATKYIGDGVPVEVPDAVRTIALPDSNQEQLDRITSLTLKVSDADHVIIFIKVKSNLV